MLHLFGCRPLSSSSLQEEQGWQEETKQKVMFLLFRGWGMQLGVGTGAALKIVRTAFYIRQYVSRY